MVSRNNLTMCRLCLSQNECYINIFEMNDWQGYVAADVISDLLQFKVSETDNYPHVACLTCLTKLTDFKLFKECCQKAKVTYDDMFASRESLVAHKPEIVEFVAVEAEPIYHSDNEDNASKACNDIDGTAGDEFKEEPMEDIVDGVHCLESCDEDPLRQSSSDVQLTLGDTVTLPQHLQYLEQKGNVDADSCARDINTNEEPIHGKSEHFSLNGGEGDGRMGTGSENSIREGMKGFVCSHCGKMLMTYKGLLQHLKLHGFGHTYDCDVCKKPFQGKAVLINHIRTHTGVKPYKCAVCSKAFSVKGSLKTHMRSHTGSKPYICGECSKCFRQYGGLQRHMRTHTGSKPYACEECGKSFGRKEDVKRHMRLHTGDKPYKCGECSKSFRQIGGLQLHMIKHSGSRPYKCEECGKSFGRNVDLRRHMRTHSSSKPYKCEECGKSFGKNESLEKHMALHTGDKPYTCAGCSKTFNYNGNLKKHMRLHCSKRYKSGECSESFSQIGDPLYLDSINVQSAI